MLSLNSGFERFWWDVLIVEAGFAYSNDTEQRIRDWIILYAWLIGCQMARPDAIEVSVGLSWV